jgi:hypothetical protein
MRKTAHAQATSGLDETRAGMVPVSQEKNKTARDEQIFARLWFGGTHEL